MIQTSRLISLIVLLLCVTAIPAYLAWTYAGGQPACLYCHVDRLDPRVVPVKPASLSHPGNLEIPQTFDNPGECTSCHLESNARPNEKHFIHSKMNCFNCHGVSESRTAN